MLSRPRDSGGFMASSDIPFKKGTSGLSRTGTPSECRSEGEPENRKRDMLLTNGPHTLLDMACLH